MDEASGRDVREPRRYKSCRVCRRLKMRCDGKAPCERCRHFGKTDDCVYDPATGRRRQSGRQNGQSSSTRQDTIQSLTAEVQSLKSHIAQSSSSPGTRSLQRDVTSETSAEDARPMAQNCEILTPGDLEIPVTAVHVMIHPSPHGEAQRSAAGWNPWNQSKWHREEYKTSNAIEKGLIDEPEARRLFGNFMHQCNICTPIFDPVLDTFESVRELYPLTLTAILSLAARQELPDDNQIHAEARKLAADTLFENPCSFDGVQAMLLLAIHSEKTWFALGHTYQMAYDLGLQMSMNRALSSPDAITRYDMQCSRLWLFLVYFERAIGLGGARVPRCETIDSADLETFVQLRHSHPSDIFFCASLELFDMSAGLRYVEELPKWEELETNLNTCIARWNTHYDNQCIHARSLQRTHLQIQTLFAKVWRLAIAAMRYLRFGNRAREQHGLCVLELIIQTDYELFAYIVQSDAYKRFFPWSPTCEVVMLTFTIIVGLKVLSMYPDIEKQAEFREAAGPIADLLQKHPCQRYSSVVIHLLQQSVASASNFEGVAEVDGGEFNWLTNDWNLDRQFDGIFDDWTVDLAGHDEHQFTM